MAKVWAVALNDLRVTFRDQSIWINLVVIPVALIFLVGLASGAFGSSEQGSIRVDVFDGDGSDTSAQLLNHLRAVNPLIVLCPMDANGPEGEDRCRLDDTDLTVERAAERLEDGDTEAVLEIPAGFGASVLAGSPAEIIYRTNDDPTQPGVVLQSLQAAAHRLAGASVAVRAGTQIYLNTGQQFDGEADQRQFENLVYARAQQYWSRPPVTVTYRETAGTEGGAGSGFRQSVPGMGTMYVMFTVLGGTVLLIQERRNWTLQRLVTMPVSRAQLLAGKMLARFIAGMIQYGVAFGFGFMIGVNFGESFIALLLVMMAFAICISALAFLLATVVSTEMQAASITTFVVLVAAPLGGAWWPLEIVPAFMRLIGHLSPVAWAMDAFHELIFYGGGLPDVVVPVAVLLAMTVVLFVIALPRFRYD